MKILIIGDSKPANNSDELFNMLAKNCVEYIWLYGFWKPKISLIGSSYKISTINPIRQIQEIISKHRIELIFIRGDWFDDIFLRYIKYIVRSDFKIPIIVGYHCHTAMITEIENEIFLNGDAFILLNKYSKEHFSVHFPISDKPIFLMDSLYFPNFDYYKNQETKIKLSRDDGEPHCVIASAVIRISGLPNSTLNENIHHENYIIDRYDYYQIAKLLASNNIHVHIYGKFQGQDGLCNDNVKLVYLKLQNEYQKYIHFEGFYDSSDFATELSKYDFTIMNGMLPNQIVPPFEHMNYQVRMNPLLAAKLPIFVAKNTYKYLEDEINKKGIGIVFKDVSDVLQAIRNYEMMIDISKNIEKVQYYHSNDYWAPKLKTFFYDVINTYNLYEKEIKQIVSNENSFLYSSIKWYVKKIGRFVFSKIKSK